MILRGLDSPLCFVGSVFIRGDVLEAHGGFWDLKRVVSSDDVSLSRTRNVTG